MDIVQLWLDERGVADPQTSVPRSEAYSDYKSWSEREHMPTLGNRRFVEELRSRGFPAGKNRGVRTFKGLRLQALGLGLHVVGGTDATP